MQCEGDSRMGLNSFVAIIKLTGGKGFTLLRSIKIKVKGAAKEGLMSPDLPCPKVMSSKRSRCTHYALYQPVGTVV